MEWSSSNFRAASMEQAFSEEYLQHQCTILTEALQRLQLSDAYTTTRRGTTADEMMVFFNLSATFTSFVNDAAWRPAMQGFKAKIQQQLEDTGFLAALSHALADAKVALVAGKQDDITYNCATVLLQLWVYAGCDICVQHMLSDQQCAESMLAAVDLAAVLLRCWCTTLASSSNSGTSSGTSSSSSSNLHAGHGQDMQLTEVRQCFTAEVVVLAAKRFSIAVHLGMPRLCCGELNTATMRLLRSANLQQLLLLDLAMAAQVVYEHVQGKSPLSAASLISSSSSSSRAAQREQLQVPPYHLLLQKALGVPGLHAEILNPSRSSAFIAVNSFALVVDFRSNLQAFSSSRSSSGQDEGSSMAAASVIAPDLHLPLLQVLLQLQLLNPEGRGLIKTLLLMESVLQDEVKFRRAAATSASGGPGVISQPGAETVLASVLQQVWPAVLHAAAAARASGTRSDRTDHAAAAASTSRVRFDRTDDAAAAASTSGARTEDVPPADARTQQPAGDDLQKDLLNAWRVLFCVLVFPGVAPEQFFKDALKQPTVCFAGAGAALRSAAAAAQTPQDHKMLAGLNFLLSTLCSRLSVELAFKQLSAAKTTAAAAAATVSKATAPEPATRATSGTVGQGSTQQQQQQQQHRQQQQQQLRVLLSLLFSVVKCVSHQSDSMPYFSMLMLVPSWCSLCTALAAAHRVATRVLMPSPTAAAAAAVTPTRSQPVSAPWQVLVARCLLQQGYILSSRWVSPSSEAPPVVAGDPALKLIDELGTSGKFGRGACWYGTTALQKIREAVVWLGDSLHLPEQLANAPAREVAAVAAAAAAAAEAVAAGTAAENGTRAAGVYDADVWQLPASLAVAGSASNAPAEAPAGRRLRLQLLLLAQQQQQLLQAIDVATGAISIMQGTGHPWALLQTLRAACSRNVGPKLMEFAAGVCAQLPVPHCCNSPTCVNMDKLDELQLVGGKACICAGCKTARYCSTECQADQWQTHKYVCKGLKKKTQATAAAAADVAGR